MGTRCGFATTRVQLSGIGSKLQKKIPNGHNRADAKIGHTDAQIGMGDGNVNLRGALSQDGRWQCQYEGGTVAGSGWEMTMSVWGAHCRRMGDGNVNFRGALSQDGRWQCQYEGRTVAGWEMAMSI